MERINRTKLEEMLREYPADDLWGSLPEEERQDIMRAALEHWQEAGYPDPETMVLRMVVKGVGGF